MIRLALALGLLAGAARAHDAASWIMLGSWRNAQTHEVCCGRESCAPVAAADVVAGSAGWFVRSTHERIPWREVLPSQDGQFWRCRRPDGSRRCFFAPVMTQ